MRFYDQQTRTNSITPEIALIAVGYFAYSFFNHTAFKLAYRTTTEYQTTKQNLSRTPVNKYESRTRLNAIKAFSLFPRKTIIAGRLTLELDTRLHCATTINYVEDKKPVEERRSRI